MSNITINKTKRDKKFNKEFSYFKSHPLYDELKNLYTTGAIVNIKSIENQFKKKTTSKKG